jgi:hypothetical protein
MHTRVNLALQILNVCLDLRFEKLGSSIYDFNQYLIELFSISFPCGGQDKTIRVLAKVGFFSRVSMSQPK